MTTRPAATVRDRALGRARYAADLVPPGALVADMARSPHPHARVAGIDPSAALATPGVMGVLTAADFEGIALGRLLADEPVLTDTARYIGDGVAAVVATDHQALADGLAALDVEYEALPHATTTGESRALGIDIHDDAPGNVAHAFRSERGDWDDVEARVVEWVEGSFETDAIPHAYLEPRATVVRVVDDRLELVTGTHFPTALQEEYAEILEPWGARLLVVQPEVGGSFGAKWEHPTHLVCLAFAHRLGRDVAMISPRRDEMIAGRARLAMRLRVSIGADADGCLIAKRTWVEADNGAYSGHGPSVTASAAIRADNLYRYDAVSVEADLVYTNTMPSECFRGFGHPQAVFAQEQLIDELAGRLGLTPGEIRRRNVVRSGDRTVHGWEISSCGVGDCLDEIESRIDAHRTQYEDESAPTRHRIGYGLAASIHGVSSRAYDERFDRAQVSLVPRSDGRIEVLSGEAEVGCGTVDMLRLIVARELDIAVDSLVVVLGDAWEGPFGLGSFASRTTFMDGHAALDACVRLRSRCAEVASELGLGADVGIDDVIAAAGDSGRLAELEVTGTFEPEGVVIPDESGYGNVSAAYNFMAHGCCVSVDTWTGKVTVERYWAAHDAGRIINPVAAEGQVIGGVTQGIGFALTEALALGPNGEVLNPGYLDDRVATFPDAVPIEAIFVDSHEPTGPVGAKTIAEPPLIPAAACVANAIHDAVGVRPRRAPMTSERTWRLLQDAATEATRR